MKKVFIIITFIICISIAIGIGYLIFPEKEDTKISINNSLNSNILNSVEENLTEEASYEEEIISHRATLIINKYYKKCKHTMTSSVDIPYDMINLSKEEVQEKYNSWEILDFNQNEISLYKEFDGICNEHYVVGVKDGYIIIYNLDEDNERTLYEITDISIEYLPIGDVSELRKGIKVEGITQLNSLLENYE